MINTLDLKSLKLNNIEMFIDVDEYRQEFLVYIIDHTKNKIISYRPKYYEDSIDLILEKCNQFNIYKVGMYGKQGHIYPIYESIYNRGVYVVDRIDIYLWRMKLPSDVRDRTHPIYYYEVQRYDFITEEEYLKLYE